MNSIGIKISAISALLLMMIGCRKEVFIANDSIRPEGWTTETHSNNVDPNYDIAFNQNKVNKIYLVFTADEWADMQTNLTSIIGSSGGGPGGGGPGGGGPGGGTFSDETPDYFMADFYFNGIKWNKIGVRYKGNSSLNGNSNKLPFRFQFDEFEDEYPEINNQRFYGFKELSMSSNFNDASLMREKSACDVFRNFGVPAVRTAFYEIHIDKGTGSYQYFGVYTMCEVVFDSFLKNYFGSETGNCYKPDGDGAKFSPSGWSLEDFEKKTNKTTGREDITAMYTALHASTRISNPSAWQAGLEATFDVDGFLRYLAANNTLQNWDTYGKMTHNYYLYNDPAMGKLRWIVWDNNEAFTSGTGRKAPLSFPMNEVGTDWPLINYIINNSDYETQYKAYVKSFANSSFAPSRMSGIYSSQQSLLTTSAGNEQSGYTYITGGIGGFNSAVSTLISHNSTRVTAANNYAP